jgi:hypothetical protein
MTMDCGHSEEALVWDDASKKYICSACQAEAYSTSSLRRLVEKQLPTTNEMPYPTKLVERRSSLADEDPCRQSEAGEYLCYYELHVDDRTFYIHTIVIADNADAALTKLKSQEGEHYHLQSKGVLGALTTDNVRKYLKVVR